VLGGRVVNEETTMAPCDLATRDCVPCKGGVPPLKGEALQTIFAALRNDWTVVNEHHLEKDYRFRNFKEALAFTNRVGELAEQVHHHPDIHLAWGRVKLVLWTHKIDGLTESDFVFAARADRILTVAS
jgi:4a-hydroxytetrahydrobiopterin dehydratase